MTRDFQLASRFVLAQSWWIASELVRRHRQIMIIETHPAGGLYDCLTLIEPSGPTTLVQMNRLGSIHISDFDGEPPTWKDAFAATGGHDLINEIEQAAGVVGPKKAAPTDEKVVCYRVIGRVLSSLVDDRHAWDARNGQIDSADGTFEQRDELSRFPSAAEAVREKRPHDLLWKPAYRFWILLRDAEPVAVLDIDGRLHLRDRFPTELLPTYKRTRSVTATIGETLGRLLP